MNACSHIFHCFLLWISFSFYSYVYRYIKFHRIHWDFPQSVFFLRFVAQTVYNDPKRNRIDRLFVLVFLFFLVYKITYYLVWSKCFTSFDIIKLYGERKGLVRLLLNWTEVSLHRTSRSYEVQYFFFFSSGVRYSQLLLYLLTTLMTHSSLVKWSQ